MKPYRLRCLPQIQLFGIKESYLDRKVVAIALLCGLQLPCQYDKSNEELLKFCPLAKGRVLKVESGFISNTNAMMSYLAKCFPAAQLMGRCFEEEILVNQWLEVCWLELDVIANACHIVNDPSVLNKLIGPASENSILLIRYLECILYDKTFLVGERMTVADVSLCISLAELKRLNVVMINQAEFPCVTRWFHTVSKVPIIECIISCKVLE